MKTPTKPIETADDGKFTHRVRPVNRGSVRPRGKYVLYWMISARRMTFNFALDRAVDYAREFSCPLVIFEPLRVAYPWASDRLHKFVIDGMADKVEILKDIPVTYFPYVEPEKDADKGLLAALAADACVVITDDFPCFFLPRMVESAAGCLDVSLEAVDSNGILPMRAADHAFTAAFHYRRHMQKSLSHYVDKTPLADSLAKLDLPNPRNLLSAIQKRWPPAAPDMLSETSLSTLPIDHSVGVAPIRGGEHAARAALSKFLKNGLDRYKDGRNEPEADVTSRLSPYLHFGQIGAHEIFHAVMRQQKWSEAKLATKPSGAREGWWGVSPGAEVFLDQLVTWRELAFNTCAFRPGDYDKFSSLPDWAQETLGKHEADQRPHKYSRSQLEAGQTHDPLWNAAMGQLREEGWFHNYMRMLWGKKILEWSRTPREALGHMIAIMDRWSLDGRDPNAYAGYFWTLGRYDRPWPERAVYGTVRSMTSQSAARKFPTEQYIARFAPEAEGSQQLRLL